MTTAPQLIAVRDMLVARPDISPTAATYVRQGDAIPVDVVQFLGTLAEYAHVAD